MKKNSVVFISVRGHIFLKSLIYLHDFVGIHYLSKFSVKSQLIELAGITTSFSYQLCLQQVAKPYRFKLAQVLKVVWFYGSWIPLMLFPNFYFSPRSQRASCICFPGGTRLSSTMSQQLKINSVPVVRAKPKLALSPCHVESFPRAHPRRHPHFVETQNLVTQVMLKHPLNSVASAMPSGNPRRFWMDWEQPHPVLLRLATENASWAPHASPGPDGSPSLLNICKLSPVSPEFLHLISQNVLGLFLVYQWVWYPNNFGLGIDVKQWLLETLQEQRSQVSFSQCRIFSSNLLSICWEHTSAPDVCLLPCLRVSERGFCFWSEQITVEGWTQKQWVIVLADRWSQSAMVFVVRYNFSFHIPFSWLKWMLSEAAGKVLAGISGLSVSPKDETIIYWYFKIRTQAACSSPLGCQPPFPTQMIGRVLPL